MRLFGRAIGRRAEREARDLSLLRVMSLSGDGASEVSSANYAQAYTLNPYVFTAVDRIAEAACTVPLVLERHDPERGWQSVPSHPLLDLLDFVSDEEDEFSLTYGTVAWLLLTGDAYWLKLRPSASAAPAGLQLLPTPVVSSRRDRTGARLFEVSVEGGTRQTVAASEIIHFRTFNPLSTERGLSRIAPLEQTINLFTRLMGFNIAWLRNGGVPSLFLKLEARMTDEQWRRFVADYRSWRANGDLAGIPFQIDARSELREIGANPDAHLSSSMLELARDTILGVIGTPPATAGVFEFANYANSREQTSMFWTQAVQPVLRLIASGLRSTLVPEFARARERLRLRYAIEHVAAMQPNQGEMVAVGRDAVLSGLLTPNEARARCLSEESVGEAGDRLYLPRTHAAVARGGEGANG